MKQNIQIAGSEAISSQYLFIHFLEDICNLMWHVDSLVDLNPRNKYFPEKAPGKKILLQICLSNKVLRKYGLQ
jgi:hypothetical protein